MEIYSVDWKLRNWLRLWHIIFATKWWSILRKKKTIWKSKRLWTFQNLNLRMWDLLRILRILAQLEVPLKHLLNKSMKTTIRRPWVKGSLNRNIREATWRRLSETTTAQDVVAVLQYALAMKRNLRHKFPSTTLQLFHWKSTGHTGKRSSGLWFSCLLIWGWCPKTQNQLWSTHCFTSKSWLKNPKRILKDQLSRWFLWTGDR